MSLKSCTNDRHITSSLLLEEAKLTPHFLAVDLVLSFAGLSGAGEWWRGRGGCMSVAAGIALRLDASPVSTSERRQHLEGWVMCSKR